MEVYSLPCLKKKKKKKKGKIGIINILIEKYKTIESKLIDNGRSRNYIADL